jgi:general secretion pathway protein C
VSSERRSPPPTSTGGHLLRDGSRELSFEVPSAAVSAKPPVPERPGVAAVDLPPANLSPPTPVAPAAPAALGVPASACGGLFVRLITVADDPKFAFASIATTYGAPAQVVHVGDRVGGFRVTGIEWDRVWVQSGGGRCAVGMHFGARDAQEAAEKELSAEAYQRLPWVLPHAIVKGLSKRSEMEFEIDAAAIAALYERGADVFAGLRVKVVAPSSAAAQAKATQPSEGEPVDARLELFDIRLDSFLERLGIESGDVLVSIDEQPTESIDAVVRALEAAREHKSLVADFTRDGEPFRLSFQLREP